ncbi:uncharacterized protein LTR77_001215 [Saxophila tyrrhenica]|uniref:Transcription initiation factor TFIID subunit 1 histone acetyltransferase domain-containing protein n=1 Tax=Saxophila tyrrhenica TaxID=1690608 RepID=A0AAV9PK63_9PEZI|nr:hypothetical protein LTR77_001215 [Saxophila tyrrhenica]
MPHATGGDRMDDDLANVAKYVRDWNEDAEFDRAIDQTDKADDAIDYESFSDDDLPEEEQATNNLDDDDPLDSMLGQQAPDGVPGVQAQAEQPRTNGFHNDQSIDEEEDADLFGESTEQNDLFQERSSSPEQLRTHPPSIERPHQRPGLALPSKKSLALPGMNQGYRPVQPPQQQSPQSMSPPSFFDDGHSPEASEDEEDDMSDVGDLKDPENMQKYLFKLAARKQAGEAVDEEFGEIDMDVFYSLYPSFEKNQNPNFVELFPPRPGRYRGKAPLKPPRSIVPTKLSLDLMADQEKAFRAHAAANKVGDEAASKPGLVNLNLGSNAQDDSDDDHDMSVVDENERIGNLTMQDLSIICGDWDIPSVADISEGEALDGEWEAAERSRPNKKRKLLDGDFSLAVQDPHLLFEDPERATAKLAKSVALDLNDQNLLVDELLPQRKRKSMFDTRRGNALNRSTVKRYNISNDEAYDALKENHHHKVRSTLGAMAIEHSLPATKLQFPFYRVTLDGKAKRAFHRPNLDVRDSRLREFRFQRAKHLKRKNTRGRETKELFGKAEDLGLGDNANVLLLEYSEEAPVMLSNFGMGSKLLNYYRKRDADDQERPKRDIGETNVLLTQDKSPFSNFGHVDKGEIVPTIHNGMYRAPIFQHKPKSSDFLVGLSSSYASGHKFYLRNVENLHTVGQQLPTTEVPTKHSRRVTDAAKKRLRALSYRMYAKSVDPLRPKKAKALNNENLMPHLPGHDMPQTRSKMREFMKYDKVAKDSAGTWIPHPGQVVPDADTLRSWIKPEDVCVLDSMQAGVQHLQDLGIPDDKNDEDDKDLDEGEHIEKQLAPWRSTKNFLAACQGKAMLKLYGDGDPTGRGEGFSFVKTSMKGGFKMFGESAEDKIAAKKRRETGGHSYNVAEQQRLYDDSIRTIWDKQKESLSAELEHSDGEIDDYHDEPTSAYPGRGATPRSSFATPAASSRLEDDSASQFSRGSAGRRGEILEITRRVIDKYGEPQLVTEQVTNAKVISLYRKKQLEKKLDTLKPDEMQPSNDAAWNAAQAKAIQQEIFRLERNADRRQAREKQKGRQAAGAAGSPTGGAVAGTTAAGSPAAQSDAADGKTPQKGQGRGRTKDGTARKCANCGQVGHIKTNRKSVSFSCLFCACKDFEEFQGGKKQGTPSNKENSAVDAAAGAAAMSSYSRFALLCPMLNGTLKPEDAQNGDSSFGAVPAPLTL